MPGRCRATNLCDYCARLAAVENAEVLAIDGMTNSAPLVWTVLTTRSTVAEMSAYKTARRAVRRAVVREWPSAEAATMIEFQSGHGRNSGGQRRPHWNDMWKGIPADQVERLHDVTAEAWCSRIDAEKRGQFAGTVADHGGLMRYLALHFQKESQQPPKGWSGQRFAVTRGYLAEPMPAMRARAQAQLRFRRELWRAEQNGLTGEEALREAERAHGERCELAWSLVRLTDVPAGFDVDGQPTSWETSIAPVQG